MKHLCHYICFITYINILQSYASVSKMSEVYLDPAQAFKMVLYAEKVNDINLVTFFGKNLHLKCLTR